VAPLLERAAPLKQLSASLRHISARGGGRAVLVRGEAGVGKTALINGFVAGVKPPVSVLQGWCDPLASPRPLGPLVDALERLDERAAATLRGALEAGDIAALYRHLIAILSGGRRWVWVIEDVHWADGATLDLLRFMGRRIGSLPMLLVMTYRDDEVGPQHPLMAAIGDMATSAALSRIRLEPLSEPAVAVLAAGSGVDAERLHQLTGGNPFYVTEVLAARHLIDDGELPRSVAEAVWGRLARLSGPGRRTAYAVAVCGPRVEPAVVQEVCADARDGLAECLDAGMLVAEDHLVGFRHELARRATLEQITGPQRRILHTRAMTAMARPPILPERLAALAFHADEAGDAEAVVRFGVAGAQRAATLGANREATELYALVVRDAGNAPAADKVVWLEGYALACGLSGRASTAEASLREAIHLRRSLGDQLGVAEDMRLLSHTLWASGHTGEALETGRYSLHLAEDLGQDRQLARSLAHMVHLTAVSYDPACAVYAQLAITLGVELGDQGIVMRSRALAALYVVWSEGSGWGECEDTLRAAMLTEGLAQEVGLVGSALCWTAALHHDLDRAQRYVEDLSAFCDRDDLGSYAPMGAGAGALVALHRGDWAAATACAKDALSRPELVMVNNVMALVAQALVRARRGGKPDVSLLEQAGAGAGPADLFLFGTMWAARAEIAWLAGDDAAAAAEAERGLSAAGPRADPWLTGRLQRWLHLTGATLSPRADGPVTPYQLEISGDWHGAAAEWARRGCPYDAALAQLGGDATAVSSAVRALRRLGAHAAARRAQQRLDALGAPKSRGSASHTKTDPDGLTRRERQILELLAAGHSDAIMANSLNVSPRTVSHHVAAILAKLGVTNRTQAAAHAHQQGPSRSEPG
jgi:DNA-binding CsgD family transcriptional regulator